MELQRRGNTLIILIERKNIEEQRWGMNQVRPISATAITLSFQAAGQGRVAGRAQHTP